MTVCARKYRRVRDDLCAGIAAFTLARRSICSCCSRCIGLRELGKMIPKPNIPGKVLVPIGGSCLCLFRVDLYNKMKG